MADVCQGLCIEWYRIFNVSLLKNESILRSSDLPVSCGAQRFHWEREEMCYSGRHTSTKHKKGHTQKSVSSVLALPIFPGRRQPSIVSRNELNYRVRNGNGWTLALISTNYVIRSYRRTSCIILSFLRFVKRLYLTFQTSKAFEK